MSSKAAAEFFNKGKEALENDHPYLARVCLENAVNEEAKPSHCSYLALALARSRGDFDRAIAMAREALAAEPENVIHHLNLGRIYIAAGRKPEAMDVFRAAVLIERNPDILDELEALGERRKPVLHWLPRSHPLNKYLGLLLAKLGLRSSRQP